MASIKPKRRAKAKTQWEREGISRTTWYRRQKRAIQGLVLSEVQSDISESERQAATAEHLSKMYFTDRATTLQAQKDGPPPRDFQETEEARIEREVDAQVSMRVQSMEGERDKALVGEFVRVFTYCNRTLDARETITLGWLTAAAVCRALVKAGY